MLCEKCGKYPATTHYKQVINGQESEMHLCSRCAGEEGVYGFEMPDLFSAVFGTPIAENVKICPTCKTSFDEIIKSGRVGCGDCYKYFEKELMQSIFGMHGHTKHIGATPKITEDIKKTDNAENNQDNAKITNLKKDLEKAIKEERYEDAAKIRDKIRDVETQE